MNNANNDDRPRSPSQSAAARPATSAELDSKARPSWASESKRLREIGVDPCNTVHTPRVISTAQTRGLSKSLGQMILDES